MANEKRLIDANAFIEALKNADADVCEEYPDCDCDWGFSRKVIVDLLKNIPTVDAVQVVRCKDCKWYKEGKYLAPNKFCYRLKDRSGEHIGYNFSDDDFCSYGERKDND